MIRSAAASAVEEGLENAFELALTKQKIRIFPPPAKPNSITALRTTGTVFSASSSSIINIQAAYTDIRRRLPIRSI